MTLQQLLLQRCRINPGEHLDTSSKPLYDQILCSKKAAAQHACNHTPGIHKIFIYHLNDWRCTGKNAVQYSAYIDKPPAVLQYVHHTSLPCESHSTRTVTEAPSFNKERLPSRLRELCLREPCLRPYHCLLFTSSGYTTLLVHNHGTAIDYSPATNSYLTMHSMDSDG